MLKITALVLIPILAVCARDTEVSTTSPPPYQMASLDIVPMPASVQIKEGEPDARSGFYLGKETPITWDTGGGAQREAHRLEAYLETGTGWNIAVEQGAARDSGVHLSIDASLIEEMGPEAYRLEKRGQQLLVSGATDQGLFYGIQTLQQMLSPEFARQKARDDFQGTCFPMEKLVIKDGPRFRWRGMHLDVGRYMYEVEDIKGFLDVMAFYKFNVFHWHLTEDQGWRIEIKAFPKLTEVGAYRDSSPVMWNRNQSDGTPYGGFYTQDEIREIVAYAADLHIDVMPEIELPGHSRAAIAAYPMLGNPEFSEGVTVSERWGVHRDTLAPTKYTLDFYEKVFDEVFELFPFEFVHIGADEAPKTQWENSPTAQARMEELGIEDEHALQAWFVAHFEKYLSEHGRRLVGWDEIQEGGLPAGATMMVWRGWHYGVEAARKGHDIIMAPTSHTYFDYYQAGPAGEPEAIGGMLPLEKVYSFEPISGDLTAEEESHVLGAQAQLWSEYFSTWAQVEYMAFPRMIALAEVVWSPRNARDWTSFQARLESQARHLTAREIGYSFPFNVFKTAAIEFTEPVLLTSYVDDKKCASYRRDFGIMPRVTLDGTIPTKDSGALFDLGSISENTTLRAAFFRKEKQVGPVWEVELTRVGE